MVEQLSRLTGGGSDGARGAVGERWTEGWCKGLLIRFLIIHGVGVVWGEGWNEMMGVWEDMWQ